MVEPKKLEGIRIFAGLTREQLEKVAKTGERREYEPGDTIFEEGDPGTHVYCIIEGRVEITAKLGDTAEKAPVHTATEGSVFGEFVLFEKRSRSADARATKPVTIFAADVDALRKAFAEDPKAGYTVLDNLCRILVDRVSKTTKELCSSLMW